MNKDDLKKTAFLISIATALQLMEYLIPAVIPGLKPGLANIITLIVLYESSYFQALEVSLLRTFMASLITGSFLSPGFFLSFSSALTSTSVMALLFYVNNKCKKKIFSIIGISILGAISHNLSQITIARIILIKNNGIFIFIPWLTGGAFITGWITAKLAYSCIKQIRLLNSIRDDNSELCNPQPLFAEDNIDRECSLKTTHLKIAALLFISIASIITSSLHLLAGIFIISFITLFILNAGVCKWLLHMKKLSVILISAALLPFIFHSDNSATPSLLSIAFLQIPLQPLFESFEYILRIAALLTFSFAVTASTPPLLLARSFAVYFKVLRFAGVSPERTASLITMVWILVPSLKNEIISRIKKTPSHKKKIRHFLPLIRDIILSFYFPDKSEKSTGFFSEKM